MRKKDEMMIANDEWSEIINLAQALMPERPTAALNRFICDKSDHGSMRGQRRRESGNSANWIAARERLSFTY